MKVDTEWLSFGRAKPIWSKSLSEHLLGVTLPDYNCFLWEWFVENFGKYHGQSFVDRGLYHKSPYLTVGSFSRVWPPLVQVSLHSSNLLLPPICCCLQCAAAFSQLLLAPPTGNCALALPPISCCL